MAFWVMCFLVLAGLGLQKDFNGNDFVLPFEIGRIYAYIKRYFMCVLKYFQEARSLISDFFQKSEYI